MPIRSKRWAIVLCVLAASAGGLYLEVRNPPGRVEEGAGEPNHSVVVRASPPPESPVPKPQLQSFEDRLNAMPLKGWDGRGSDPRRAAVLAEWLAADRKAAMQFLAKNRFKDLRLPGISKLVGEKATAQELLDIANGSDTPWDGVFGVGKWAPPDAVNGLANLMASVDTGAMAPTAAAVAGLLANINLDRALAFAMSQPSDQARASAIGGVFDEMRSGPNGDNAIRSLYATLPPSMQTADPVLFSYGNAIWGSDPATALQVLESISSSQMRTNALLVLSRDTASSSPETAIAAVYATGLTPQGIFNHVNPIIQNWSAVDPQAAANFLSTTQIIPSADLPKYAPPVSPPGGGKG